MTAVTCYLTLTCNSWAQAQLGSQCCQDVLYVPGPFLLHKQGQFTSTLSSNLAILPSPSHSSLRITSWFAGTEASVLSETSSHPCLHLLCPPTTDKHRCCCINSQAPYLCARFHLISPRTWFQPPFPSPTSSVFLLLLGHLINQMPLFHLKTETKNLTLLLLSASIPLLCSCYSRTPHSSCVWFHSTKTAPIDSQWPSHWQTQFLSWLLTRPVSIIDTSDPFPLTHLRPLASNWPVITPFHFPPLVPLLSS